MNAFFKKFYSKMWHGFFPNVGKQNPARFYFKANRETLCFSKKQYSEIFKTVLRLRKSLDILNVLNVLTLKQVF